MNRTSNRDKTPNVKKVEHIDLNDRHFKVRLIAVILCVIVAAGAFALGIRALVNKESGWYEVTANSDKMTCADDFSFYYRLGLTSENPNAELKRLSILYSEVASVAYELFNTYEEFDGVHNLYYINHHINEEIVVDGALYNALKLFIDKGNKSIYLGPIYEYYSNIFMCAYDYEIYPFDPIQNETIREYYKEIIGHIDDIELQLLDNNKIKLVVSDSYINFAKEKGFENYIDLSYFKNAFIIDYFANTFKSNGFSYGTISSSDGFVRCFDLSDEEHSFSILKREDNSVQNYSSFKYKNEMSIVFMHTYPLNARDAMHIFLLENGETRHSYLSTQDGINKACLNELVSYSPSKENGCSEILLEASNILINDELDVEKLNLLTNQEIHSIYFDKNGLIKVTSPDLTIE